VNAALRPVAIFVIGPNWNRYPAPTKRSFPPKRKDPPWVKQSIPSWDRQELQRRIEDMRERARRTVSETRSER
jgi:hypothetical protein